MAGSLAVGGLLSSRAFADDSPSPSGFSLTARTASRASVPSKTYGTDTADGTSYADVVDYLNGFLPTVAVGDVSLNRKASVVPASVGPGSAFSSAFIEGYSWDSGDQSCDYWIPQGITTSYDANGSSAYAGKRLAITSWHFVDTLADASDAPATGDEPDGAPYWTTEADPNDPSKTIQVPAEVINRGVRVTLFDLDTRYYRHVLLVDPYRSTLHPGRYTFAPVPVHAGGIALYGNHLYVVDTTHGIRVFDLDNIWQVSTDGTADKTIGYTTDYSMDGFTAYGYNYVLPQVMAYDTVEPFRYSFCSVDRSTPAQPELVVGEYTYTTSGSSGRVISFPLSLDDDLLASTTANRAVTIAQRCLQSVLVAPNGPTSRTYYFTVSNHDSAHVSDLARWSDDDAPTTLRYQHQALVPGPEDMAWGNLSGTKAWTQSEGAGTRYLYAVDPSSAAYTYPSSTSTGDA